MALTNKQAQFAAEYLVDLNATQAAIRCGYAANSADVTGARLLGNASVRAEVDRLKQERSQSTGITAERVLQEIALMATWDPADIMREIGAEDADDEGRYRYSDDGKIYGLRGPGDIRALPENVRRAIVGWSWDKAGNFVVKLADKSKALDQLARHLSLYNDKLEVTGIDALADRLARASQRDE